MKQKLALALSLLIFSSGVFAQTMDTRPEVKPALFGIHFNILDFKTPETFKNTSSRRFTTNLRDMDFGFGLSYWKGLTKTIDFSTKFNAMMHDYSIDRGVSTTKTEVGLELEPTLNFRPFKDNSLIAPFLTAGIGGGYYTGEWGAYA